MIVVTGSARTGTSMMMQTLGILGVGVPAPKFLPQHSKTMEHNPKGYYEFYDEVLNGVHHHQYKGQAIKMFGGCLYMTPKQYVSKVIVCKRNKKDTTKSYVPVLLKDFGSITGNYSPDDIYEANYYFIESYIKSVPSIFINFESMKQNPRKEIAKVIKFLGLTVSDEILQEAVNNVNK